MITYLDSNSVTETRQTTAPVNRSRSGYGRKIPSSWLLKIGGRWHRVYVICYSNAGSAYVLIRGALHFLGSYDPSYEVTL